MQQPRPDDVAVALDDGVRAAEIARFLGKERRVDPAVDDRGAARASQRADLVAAQGVAGVDADADDIAGLHGIHLERLECLVRNARVAELSKVWPRRGRTANGE